MASGSKPTSGCRSRCAPTTSSTSEKPSSRKTTNMDLSQFLLALRARRKAFMLALVATIVAALAVAFVMPKKYVGQATLIVDARDEQAIIPSRSSVSISTRAAYVATQIELVQ